MRSHLSLRFETLISRLPNYAWAGPSQPIDVNAMTKDQIKGCGAISAGVVSNVVGIPLDGFRVREV